MVEIRDKDFSIDEVIKKLKKPEIGGIVTYLGTVRETSLAGEKVERVEFSYDEKMKQKLQEIEKKAIDKFDIKDIAIVQRVGSLEVGENILLVAVSATHREPGFTACRDVIDEIKNKVHSVWKKEITL